MLAPVRATFFPGYSGPRVESVRAEVTLDMKLYSTLLSYSTLTKHKYYHRSMFRDTPPNSSAGN